MASAFVAPSPRPGPAESPRSPPKGRGFGVPWRVSLGLAPHGPASLVEASAKARALVICDWGKGSMPLPLRTALSFSGFPLQTLGSRRCSWPENKMRCRIEARPRWAPRRTRPARRSCYGMLAPVAKLLEERSIWVSMPGIL